MCDQTFQQNHYHCQAEASSVWLPTHSPTKASFQQDVRKNNRNTDNNSQLKVKGKALMVNPYQGCFGGEWCVEFVERPGSMVVVVERLRDMVLVVVLPRKAEVARAHRRRTEHPLTQGCHN